MSDNFEKSPIANNSIIVDGNLDDLDLLPKDLGFKREPTPPDDLEIENIVQKDQIIINQDYRQKYKVIGDHVKLAREIVDQEKAINVFNNLLNQKFPITRMVLMNHDCKEKDIVWQKNI